MSNDVLAAAFRKIAEGYYNAADVLFEAGDAVHIEPGRSVAPVPSEPDFPPFTPADESPYEPLAVAGPIESPMLSHCPTHDTPWTVKPGGVSKAGKSYTAFWKCDGKNPDGTWCAKKPVRAWADAHPLVAA